ncbi:hypothetical protein [Reyranella sp.]|uniref:hypothetical protein n=1 Tax=Reyranella sp. TaxID=1929291 RepID=UPI003782FF9D
MADEQVIRGKSATDTEQRAAAETLEIERWSQNGADDASRQTVFDTTTPIEMAEECDRIAKEPSPGAGNGGQHRQVPHEHLAAPPAHAATSGRDEFDKPPSILREGTTRLSNPSEHRHESSS